MYLKLPETQELVQKLEALSTEQENESEDSKQKKHSEFMELFNHVVYETRNKIYPGSVAKPADKNAAKTDAKADTATKWTDNELSLLARGMAKFPGGSKNRWESIAMFIGTKTAKEVVQQVNAMKQHVEQPVHLENDFEKLKKVTEKDAQRKEKAKHAEEATLREPENMPSIKPAVATAAAKSWSAAQQKALEKGLKTTDAKDPQRWDKIAAMVEGKTKEECVARYKYLVEELKKKKAAQAQQK
eukprot:GEZU01022871.1.p2 GENE.GEZU01022871.1~~GEZU01022871.1.p2  ORF type:complete len:244 (-),score=106.96 GEZU01022871.1:70-801(-)